MTADYERDEIGRLLRSAYDAAPSPEFVESLRTRSEDALRAAIRGGATAAASAERHGTMGNRRLRRSALAIAAVAAVLLVCLLPWLAGARTGWAAVVEAVQARPWIHATVTGPDGQTGEFWFSFVHAVSASRGDGVMGFCDHRVGIVHFYDSANKQLIRSADVYGRNREGLQRFQGAFEAIFRGEEKLDSPLIAANVVHEKRRRVSADGTTWIEYELLLEMAAKRARLVFRVDPGTRLPESMRLVVLDEGEAETTFHFDYPEEGPADVYALGVPRDAELVDRVPKGDLTRLLRGVKASRERFPTSYYAIVINSPMPSDNPMRAYHSFTHFWRKANKWRLEWCFPDGSKGREALLRMHQRIREAKLPAPGDDLTAWRKTWLVDFKFGPAAVCDGETIYRNTSSLFEPTWEVFQKVNSQTAGSYLPLVPSECVPERVAYPGLLAPSEQFAVELTEAPDEGPPGTVLYEVRPTVENAGGLEMKLVRYWIDPARSCVNLRYEQEGADGERSIYVKEGLQQTPNGLWYPTVVRWKNHGMEQEDGEGRADAVWYLYVDFDAELPDSLFQPADRPADD